ncbi:MAG: hypothetical protein ACXAC7_08630 [Candidatus Hodarchaeales archaeon]|jgi:hypothetical protein
MNRTNELLVYAQAIDLIYLDRIRSFETFVRRAENIWNAFAR